VVNNTPTPTKVLKHSHEVFAQGLARSIPQTDAYKEAYPKSRLWTAASVANKASVLAKNPAIVARLAEIRAPIIRDIQLNTAGYGLIQAMKEAAEALEMARETRQSGAMVAAVQLRAKLNALLIDRKEIAVTQLDGFDPSEKLMMLDQLQAALAERKRLAMGDVTDVEAKP
jgi:hypothetical protein